MLERPTAVNRSNFQPAYLELWQSGELVRRIKLGLEKLADCVLCPRNCHVNRIENKTKVCRTGRYAIVSSHFAHFGEENACAATVVLEPSSSVGATCAASSARITKSAGWEEAAPPNRKNWPG